MRRATTRSPTPTSPLRRSTTARTSASNRPGGSKVDVQVEGGPLDTAALDAGTANKMNVRKSLPGSQAEGVNGTTGAVIIEQTSASTFTLPVRAGSSYHVEQPSNPTTSLTYA